MLFKVSKKKYIQYSTGLENTPVLLRQDVVGVFVQLRIATDHFDHASVCGLADLWQNSGASIAEEEKAVKFRPRDPIWAEQLRNNGNNFGVWYSRPHFRR